MLNIRSLILVMRDFAYIETIRIDPGTSNLSIPCARAFLNAPYLLCTITRACPSLVMTKTIAQNEAIFRRFQNLRALLHLRKALSDSFEIMMGE